MRHVTHLMRAKAATANPIQRSRSQSERAGIASTPSPTTAGTTWPASPASRPSSRSPTSPTSTSARRHQKPRRGHRHRAANPESGRYRPGDHPRPAAGNPHAPKGLTQVRAQHKPAPPCQNGRIAPLLSHQGDADHFDSRATERTANRQAAGREGVMSGGKGRGFEVFVVRDRPRKIPVEAKPAGFHPRVVETSFTGF